MGLYKYFPQKQANKYMNILNITNKLGHANQSHNVSTPYSKLNDCYQKDKKQCILLRMWIKREHWGTAGGNVIGVAIRESAIKVF